MTFTVKTTTTILSVALLCAGLAVACDTPIVEGEGEEGEGEEGEGEEGEGEEGEGEEGEGEEGEGEEGEGEEGEGEEGEGEGEEGEGEEGEGEGEGEFVDDCFDGVDNDGDFLFDGADPSCQAGLAEAASFDQCNDGVDNDFDCLADGQDPDCAASGIEARADALPDMWVDDTPDRVGVSFLTGVANPGDPEVEDRCFTGLGTRKELRFNSYIGNRGTAPLRVTTKEAHPTVWTLSPGFGGLRYEGWSRFFLLDAKRDVVAFGHKSSFAMVDIFDTPEVPNVGPDASCPNGDGQGVSVGMADIYNDGLDCQFIDVTDVEPGVYTLRIEANWDRQLPDSDLSNNFAELPVTIR